MTLEYTRHRQAVEIFCHLYTHPLKNLDASAGSNDDDLGNLYNPLVSISDNAREKTQKRLNLAGSASWEIIDNLRLRSEAGLDHQDDGDQRFWGLTTYYIKNYPSVDNQGKPAIRLVNRERQTLRNTNTLNYDFKKYLKEDHSLNLMAGHEYIIRKGLTLTDEVHGFPLRSLQTMHGGSPHKVYPTTSTTITTKTTNFSPSLVVPITTFRVNIC